MMLPSLLIALWIGWLLFLLTGNFRLQRRWLQPSTPNPNSPLPLAAAFPKRGQQHPTLFCPYAPTPKIPLFMD